MSQRVGAHLRLARPAGGLLVSGLLLLALLVAGCDGLAPAPGLTPTPAGPPGPEGTPAAPAPPTETPLPTLPPTATLVPPSPTPQPRTLAGHVLDSYSGRPVP